MLILGHVQKVQPLSYTHKDREHIGTEISTSEAEANRKKAYASIPLWPQT